jgi:hypothetical protein
LAAEQAILHKRLIDFKEVYGISFEDGQHNLFKYFVKSLGCRLISAGLPVPQDLVDLLPRKVFRTALKITFCVNEDILLLPASKRSRFIGKGDLIALMSASDLLVLNGYTWNEYVSWFTVCYWYGVQPEGGLGSTWIADAQHVYLGSVSPLSAEQRAEFLKDLCEDHQDAQGIKLLDS